MPLLPIAGRGRHARIDPMALQNAPSRGENAPSRGGSCPNSMWVVIGRNDLG